MVTDGWHVIQGERVYVKDGDIVRAIKADRNGGDVPAAVYRWSRQQRVWIIDQPISTGAFTAGMKRGTIAVM